MKKGIISRMENIIKKKSEFTVCVCGGKTNKKEKENAC